ncbi:MAG: DHHA1 domain-containing protein [Desulfurococcaceae archaeon]
MARWVLLVHGDSDGVCSGAIAKASLAKGGEDVNVVFTHPVGLAKDLAEFTQNGDNVLVADVALNERELGALESIVRERSTHGRFIYIDHHPLPERALDLGHAELVHDTCCAASELTYRFFEKEGLIEEEYSRIALYGAIGDYVDETPWVRNALARWDKRGVYYEAGILVLGLERAGKNYELKRRVVDSLSKNGLPSSDPELFELAKHESALEEELRLWVKQNVVVVGLVSVAREPRGSLGRAAHYARIYGNTPIGLAYERRGNMLIMSLRSDVVDLNRILRAVSREMDISGGGHDKAAGARVEEHKFEEFLRRLSELAGEELQRRVK